jgi:hypothetical protein
MKFLVQVEVTSESSWLDGSPDFLGSLLRSESPESILQETLWRRIGNKEPRLQVGEVRRIE